MIFTDKLSEIDEILEAIGNAGVSKEYIEIGRKYLDMSKSCNVSMLKDITPHDVSSPEVKTTYNGNIEFYNKVDKHIMKNPELTRRYIQFCYAVAGSSCWKFFRGAGYLNYYNNEYKKLAKEALVELISSAKLEAAIMAIDVDMCTYRDNINIANDKRPEIYLQAAELSLRDNAKALLCCYALANSNEYDDIVRDCFKILKESTRYYSSNLRADLYRLSLAECAYFDESYKPVFREQMQKNPEILVVYAIKNNFSCGRIFNLITEQDIPITETYIHSVVINSKKWYHKKTFRKHLKHIILHHEKTYVSAMKNYQDAEMQLIMLNFLREIRPEYNADDCGLKETARQLYINHVYESFCKSADVYDYITGVKTLDEIIDKLGNIGLVMRNSCASSYCNAYGIDDIVRRAVTVYELVTADSYSNSYYRRQIMGDKGKSEEIVDILFSENVPVEFIINHSIGSNLVNYAEKVAQADVSKLTTTGRNNYIWALSKCGDKYKKQIFAMAGDTSKVVRGQLVTVISKMKNCDTEIADMMSSKKASVRELALEVMTKMQGTDWSDILKNALEKEKSEKLKAKIMEFLGIEQEEKEVTDTEIVAQLTKASKVKKISWLYQSPYKTVHFADKTDVPENYMQAVLICYADGNYHVGRKLSEKINPDDLAEFSVEVLGRWIDLGAVAKNKWVLVFSAVNGKSDVISKIMSYIKYWSENQRGALAVSAVKALALNGSPEALMQVDNMSRKFKSNQVKAAAQEALIDAAEFLGITIEELSDRIVPDFDFDEHMCRIFDYGNRKFSVYLTPSLEIEIFNGDKKIKNLPKPSANDITEIAEKSYAEFKEMKKQLKSAVKLQTARLEYTLMCERKWTKENWEKLFVKNPLMHCFAIGLVWGIYNTDGLVSTFRYLDDGSFTTADEEEFEIPENAEISLVHPVELSEEELSAWTEQLADYEITQPFLQLARPVYRPEKNEVGVTEIKRFYGKTVIDQILTSRMEKNGWYRGYAGDGGCFYEFCRCDISRKIKSADGESIPVGYGAELSFSGTYIGVYQREAEDVEIENVCFYYADNMAKKIPVSEVSDRYFSEIIMQLTAML